jgi:D-sedoheptulose 7-phosphate isomerase
MYRTTGATGLNRIEELFQQAGSPAEFARGYFVYLGTLLDRIDEHALGQVVEVLMEARAKGQYIYVMGNGGSAATATHFANDLAICTRAGALPFLAQSCTDNVPALTSISNDFGFEEVFFKQLEHRVNRGDVVIAISASGNSENILKAVDYANSCDCVTVGFTGFDGGHLRERARIAVHVPSGPGEYGPVEDLHMIFDHVIANYLMLLCRAER